jgi:hypothetical protein
VAAAAVVIDRTELNQQAMIATDDFPRIYWGKSRSHRVVGVPEPATPYYSQRNQIGGEIPAAEPICGTRPVDVKVKMDEAVNNSGENRNDAVKIPQKQGRKHD